MTQMLQEKWEQKVGFKFSALFPNYQYIHTSRQEASMKREQPSMIDHDADKKQVYEIRVRIWYKLVTTWNNLDVFL